MVGIPPDPVGGFRGVLVPVTGKIITQTEAFAPLDQALKQRAKRATRP